MANIIECLSKIYIGCSDTISIVSCQGPIFTCRFVTTYTINYRFPITVTDCHHRHCDKDTRTRARGFACSSVTTSQLVFDI